MVYPQSGRDDDNGTPDYNYARKSIRKRIRMFPNRRAVKYLRTPKIRRPRGRYGR